MFTQRNGFVWPEKDRDCHRVVFSQLSDMEPAMALCRGFDVAVQAGGNCGVWPAWLAGRFAQVYTFEPDAVNYGCLVQNVPANVHHRMAALGDAPGTAGMVTDEANIGAHYMAAEGEIEVVTVDSLKLPACDYLCLDVEGYELKALQGAAETIAAHHPVIQIGEKGLSRRYGTKKGAAEAWLQRFGYTVHHRVARDVVLA